MTDWAELTEEQRIDAIRNDPANRIKRMGESRAARGRQSIPFSDLELIWLKDEIRNGPLIPYLEPCQYWALVVSLATDLSIARARNETNRAAAAMDTSANVPVSVPALSGSLADGQNRADVTSANVGHP